MLLKSCFLPLNLPREKERKEKVEVVEKDLVSYLEVYVSFVYDCEKKTQPCKFFPSCILHDRKLRVKAVYLLNFIPLKKST